MQRTPPTIAELTAGYVARAEDAETLTAAIDALGDVEPHEVSVGLRAEPRLAWAESLEILQHMGIACETIPAPADWGALVVKQQAVPALPFALGSYPQRVRELSALLQSRELKNLLPKSHDSTPATGSLARWCDQQLQSRKLPHALIAAAICRVTRDFDKAQNTLQSLPAEARWAALIGNEQATLAWEMGNYAEARKLWAELPDSAPVHFNRGLAELFLGQRIAAIPHFKKAVELLPESSAWHHLANLYLVVAGM